jgi:hypothetical protein
MTVIVPRVGPQITAAGSALPARGGIVHHHYRQRAGRAGGLAAALAALGLVCGSGVPALAAPAGPAATSAGTAPAATAVTAAHPGRQLLLVNGDRLVVRSTGGKQAVAVRAAARGDALTSLKIGGQVMEIPAYALPYLNRGLSPSLFEVGALEKAETGGRLPVQLTFSGRRPSVPGLKVTRSSAGAASGYLTASSARAFGAALKRQYLADHARGRFGTDGVFGHSVSISLAGSPARRGSGPAPAFRQHTLTVHGLSTNGKPDTGDQIFVASADSGVIPENFSFFFHGVAKFSVPGGHYWALALFTHFTSTGGAIRVVVVPQFTVAGKRTSLRVAARSASSEFTTAGARPTVTEQAGIDIFRGETRDGPSVFGESVSGLSLWVSPTTRKPTVGTLRSYSAATLVSPARVTPGYVYNLDFPGPAGTIPSQHFAVAAASLATVTERYFQDVRSDGASIAFGGTAAQLEAGAFLPTLPVTMPAEQTQYFSAGHGILWSSQTVTNLDQFSGGDTDAFRAYAAGQQATQDWNRYPLHPAPDVVLPGTSSLTQDEPSAFRSGNTLDLGVTPFSDNEPGHLGAGFFDDGTARVTGRYVVDQNGKKIAAGNAVNGIPGVELSARPATIRFALDAARSSSFFRLSPSSHTVWTWRSVRDTAARVPASWFCFFKAVKQRFVLDRQCAVQPMMTLNYQVQGLALSGLTAPGAQVIDLTAGHIQLAASPAITGATAQVSYNDGDSWQPATVTAEGSGGFRIGYSAPAGVDVSLRVSATDAAGGSISETIVRAYGVSQ